MCIAVRIHVRQKPQQIWLGGQNAYLPYYNQSKCLFMGWGRREQESGALPIGGWARDDILQRGLWDAWFPKHVLLPINAFCLHDYLGKTHWFELSTAEYLQGTIVHEETEQRIYINTFLTERLDNCFLQWPKVIKQSRGMVTPLD